jgi:hypothetical protein
MFRKESGAQRNGVTDQSQRRPRRGYGRSVRKTKVNMSVIEGGEADVSDLSSISNNDVHVGRRSMGHLCGREVIVTYITIAPARCEEEINIRVELSHHRSLRRHPDCFAVLFGGGVIAVMLYTYLHDYAARSNALRKSVFPKRKGR